MQATEEFDLVRRFIQLPPAQRTLFLDKMVAKGLSLSQLPIPVSRHAFEQLPLSYAQQRQWFLWQLEPDSAAYNMPSALRLRGALDKEALRRSLDMLMSRHETLRTTFHQQAQGATQVVHPAGPVELDMEDAAVGDLQIREWIDSEARRPFDLEHGPLLRARLLRLSDTDHVLALTVHHIVSDAWSMRVLIDELMQLYVGFSEGRRVTLPDLPIQYADYALWQRAWMEAGEQQRQLDYWSKQLGGEQPMLVLPADHPRPSVQSHRGARLNVSLPAELGASLRQLAQREQVTLFMLLLTSFQVLLHRYSGGSDVRVGVPIANRTRTETERLIGFFVNTQVLKASIDGRMPFVRLLEQVKQTALAAQTYQDLPFEQLVEALQPQRTLSHTPLFQVMYNHQSNQQAQALQLAGLDVEILERARHTTHFDLALDTYDSPAGLFATLTYAADLFEPVTIERLASHWLNLLAGICERPEQKVCELPMLGVEERRDTLRTWDQTHEDYPSVPCVHEAIDEAARRTPHATAVICGEHELTYEQLNNQANRLAHRLMELGVGPEVRVAIVLQRSPELVVALLAVLKAGGAYVPLDVAYPEDRLLYMMQDCSAALVLSQSDVLSRLPIPSGVTTVAIDDADAWCDYSDATPGIALSPENLAYVIYTSGSTGRPKGVAVAHGPIAMHCRAIAQRYEMSATDCELQFMSFAFDGAHERWLTTLTHGARLLIRGEELWSPEQTYEIMRRQGVTVTALPPVYLQHMAEYAQRDGNPPAVRIYCFAGDAFPQATFELARRTLRPQYIFNGYGPTETVVTPLLWKAGKDDVCGAAYAPIGTLLGRRRSYVLDADLSLLPVGLDGELYLGGEGVARGYLNRPALTAERFVPDPFGQHGERVYRSGDLTRARPNGWVDYLGRVDLQVKIRGFRIELGEIEAKLQEHAEVREAVVVAQEGPSGKQLVGYVVANDAAAVDATTLIDQLRTTLKATLPDYMVPAHLMVLDTFPLTPNGKLDRKALPPVDVSLLQKEYVAPQTDLQQRIAAIWAEVLRLERVGLHDNFFELGGDSIVSIQVVSRARQAGIRFTPKKLFQHQTVQALASVAELEDEAAIDPPADAPSFVIAQEQLDALPVPSDRIEAVYPLSPMQEGMLLHTLLEPGSGIYCMQDRFEIDSEIGLERFTTAWQLVVNRHDAMRASFNLDREGRMLQIAHRDWSPPVTFLDWSDRAETEQETALLELLKERREQGFDLLRSPPLRLLLVRRGQQRYGFVLEFHHILMDDWCRSLILRDFFAFYRGDATLPAAGCYRDFITWLKNQGTDAALNAWRAELADFEEVTPLPFDRPLARKQGVSSVGDRKTSLAIAAGRRLKELAQRHQLTINTFAQAAWALVLHRFSGLNDVLFGVTVAGRPISRPEMHRTVGLFINSIPLRVRVPSPQTRLTVKQWLQDLLAHNFSLREHEHLPLVQIQTCSAVDRGASLFDSLLVYENAPFEHSIGADAKRLRAAMGEVRTHTNYPITVVINPGEALGLHLSYDRRFFDEVTIDRLLAEFERLLLALSEGFYEDFSALPLATDDEYRALKAQAELTRREYPFGEGYVRLFERQADARPEHIVASCLNEAWSYRELDRKANAVGNALLAAMAEDQPVAPIAAGMVEDQPVALLAERGLELLAMMIGTFKAGAGNLAPDPHLPDGRLLEILTSARPRFLLAAGVNHSRAEQLVAGLPAAFRPTVLSWDQLQESRCDRPGIYTGARHLSYVIYTSGSTGVPKGVLVEQAGMLNNQLSKVPYLALTDRDVIAQTASQSFDISVWQFLTAPLCGAQVDIVPNEIAHDPAALLEHVRERNITVLESVPALIQSVLDLPDKSPGNLRWMLPTGEAMAPELARRWRERYPRIGLVNAYGPAECSDDVALYRVEQVPAESAWLPIGSATDNNQLYILNGELQPVPVGAVGELHVSGTGVGRGYLHAPARTADVFLPNPIGEAGTRLYRTGDLARYRTDGAIEYVGRIDHQVKIRGFRIELGEIEARLREQANVREAVVVAQEGPGGKQLVAYVVATDGLQAPSTHSGALERGPVPSCVHDVASSLSSLMEQLRAALQSTLPDYMVPTHVVMMEQLPLSPNGKLDRKALPKVDASALRREYVEPQTDLHRQIAAIWADVLGLERVGLHDNFFELGGHSLLATQAVSRVNHQLGTAVPLRAAFEAGDLISFAAVVQRSSRNERSAIAVADRSKPLPLSYAQQRQWFLWQLEPQSAAYHIPVALRLHGRADLQALRLGVEALVSRHEVLRTSFAQDNGEAVQVIHEAASVTVDVIDHAGEDRIRAWVETEIRRPFDLTCAPLLRVKLLRVDAQESVLVLVMHHIVSDGWSMPILVDELVQLYEAYRQHRGIDLPKLPIQYADYAVWQRTWLEAGERQRQLAYWMKQLGGEQPLLELPLDRSRPAVQSYRGARIDVPLGDALGAAIRTFARSEGVTVFVVLLASFQALLYRYTGQRDIRVGMTIANRNRVETERLIGFFVNTQVLRAEVDGQMRFGELLQQSRRTVLEAQAHQDLPFEQLVEALQPERSLSHSPLFQVMVNHQAETRDRGHVLPGLKVENVTLDAHPAQFDLTLNTYETNDGLFASLTYATDLFEARTIERLGRHWRRLLENVVRRPLERIDELPLLGDEERQRQLVEWNRTGAEYRADRCIHEVIEAQVASTPDVVAAIAGEVALTYRQLNTRANQLAHWLTALGVGPEVRVGIAVDRGLDMVVGLLGILKAGGAYVPLDPQYPRDRLAYMIADSTVPLLLTQTHLKDQLPVSETVRVLCLDEENSYSSDATDPGRRSCPENLAYVIYTSGSTGKPKGVAIAHRNTMALIDWSLGIYSRDDLQGVLASTSLCFDLSVWEIFVTLAGGGCIVIAGNALELSTLPARDRVSLINTVPSAIEGLWRSGAIPPNIRIINLAGEPLKQSLVDDLYANASVCHVYDLYGPSEDTTYSTFARRELQGKANIGRPIGNTNSYLLDAGLSTVPTGVAAELYLGGAGITRGYHARPALTAERFIPYPFDTSERGGGRLYRTGDLARHRPDGVIEYVGRIDHQVKVRGFRIELGEIETKLREQPTVRDAVVLAQPAATGKQLVAYVVPVATGKHLAACVVPDGMVPAATSDEPRDFIERLKAALRASLPDYMVPAHFLLMDALPLTPNGKLDRKALPLPESDSSQAAYIAPVTESERQLATIWAGVLGLERVGVTENFFELGGDSIVSIQMVGRAREAGVHITPKQLFQHQTIQSLAAVAGVHAIRPAIDQGPAVGDAPLLPIQHWFFEQDVPQRHHWNQAVLLEPTQPLDPDRLEQALRALVVHHDALRLRFVRDTEGWSATHGPVEPAPSSPLLWRLGSATASERLAEHAALENLGHRIAELAGSSNLGEQFGQAQASLDLESGPLLRAVLTDNSQRLMLAIHHLVVDGVSWRVLLEDLQTAYRQLPLPAKTSAYQAWGARLKVHARAESLQSELEYWQGQLAGLVDLPRDRVAGTSKGSSARVVHTRLDRALTQRLLQDAPSAYRTQINDLLLTALARVMTRWTHQSSMLVQLEGHGREEVFDDIDLTRTVGWFTTMYPARLTPSIDLDGSIKQIKEQLRAVPGKGLGYGVLRYLGDEQTRRALSALPAPRITFNYLGQFDGTFAREGQLFVPANGDAGPERSDDAPLDNWLSIEGRVYAGQLSLGWTFSDEMFDETTIQRLADAYSKELRDLIEHCTSDTVAGVTPSDFALARLTQAQLDALTVPARQIEDLYPLSPMQEGMLFHTLYRREAGDYINQLRVDVEGLEVARFEAAWGAAVERHDVLRASFITALERPLQVIRKHVDLPFASRDWSSRAELQHDLDTLAQSERDKGFDLQQGPLLRLAVVRTGPNRHHVIYTHHHILLDGWSSSQLLDEVLRTYAGTPIARQRLRYRDYIEWLQRQDVEASQRFWQRQLHALEEPTRLAQAISAERHDAVGVYGDHYQTFASGQLERLKSFARQQRVTLNTLVQAAWLLLLRQYTGQEAVTFGATVAGRPANLAGAAEQIGLFINTLPIVASPRPQQRVGDWIEELQEQNLLLREQEHTPLYEIQRWVGRAGETLFDTILVFENYPVSEALQRGASEQLKFCNVHNHEQTHYPLTLAVGLGSTLSIQYSYDRAHFDAASVAQIARHFGNLLDALACDPQRCVGELPLLDDDERDRQVVQWNRTHVDYPLHLGYVRLFESQVALHGDRIVARQLEKSWTYRELDEHANRLGHALLDAGVSADRPVALMAPRGLALLGMMIGAFKAGAAFLSLDLDLPRQRLLSLLREAQPLVWVVERDGRELAEELLTEWHFPWRPVMLDWEEVQAGDAPAVSPRVYTADRHLSYVIYTSGSTGTPKGVMVEQSGMLNNQLSKVPYLQLTDRDVIAQTASQSFDISVWQFLTAPLCGAQVDIVPNAIAHDPMALLRHTDARGVTVVESVPSLIQAMLDTPRQSLGALRWMLPTGEALSPALAHRWLERYPTVGLVNAYGPAECSDDVALRRIAATDTAGAVLPIGTPTDNNALYVLSDELQPAPVATVGELYVAGIGVGRGYLADPARSAQSFLPDPFSAEPGGRLYRTGDLARYRADGSLEYVGRADHQVKIRGFRIELGEIETRLLADDRVYAAAVVAQESIAGKQLVAYVVPTVQHHALFAEDAQRRLELQRTYIDALKTALRDSLPEYMVPAHVVVLRTLPLTANGKLDRKALPKPDVNQLRRTYLAPETDRERQIAAIWSQVLEVERVGLDDDFFELGGHSLLATRVISRINAQLGIDIPLRSLFEAPALRDFCRTLDSAGSSLSDAGLSDIEQLMDEMVES